MSVNLRDRLFNDTGGVVQGATVQAILVTGGGTDAGTGSVVQATTTTDVNGVWKFSALPDPGTGNWYDVKIINGNQVRWRYGNIQSLLNQLLIGTTGLTFSGTTTMSAATVTGNLQVQGLFQLGASNWAGAGTLRLPNAAGVNWRNAANTNDNCIFWGVDETFHFQKGLSDIVLLGADGVGAYLAPAGLAGSVKGFLRLPNNSESQGGIGFRNGNNSGDCTIYCGPGNRMNLNGWATSGSIAFSGSSTGTLAITIAGTNYLIPYVTG